MKLYYFSALLISFYALLLGQRLVEREIIINPMFGDLPSTHPEQRHWMTSISGWGGFGYYTAGDREHEWYQKLGALIELYRQGNHTSISFVSHIEFIANDRNDMGFNPRALVWEEGFLYSKRLRQSFLQIGYYHRCKHDLENLSEGYERSLIFGGLQFKFIMPVHKSLNYQWSYMALRAEIYTIRQDSRFPDEFMAYNPNLEQLLGTVAFNFNNHKSLSGNFGVYINSYGSLNLFGNNKGFISRFQSLQTMKFSGGISTGFAVQGRVHFRIGLNFEYFSDTAIDPRPAASSLFRVGIQIIDPKVIR